MMMVRTQSGGSSRESPSAEELEAPPPQAAAAAPAAEFKPWAEAALKGVEWKGVSAAEHANSASAIKNDIYERPVLPKTGKPSKIWSFGALIAGMAPRIKNWRCLHRMTRTDGSHVACGAALKFPEAHNVWAVRVAQSSLLLI